MSSQGGSSKMFARVLLALALSFASRDVVRAQSTSTATLLPIAFQSDKLQGEQIGTGTGGTTYQLSGTFNSLSIPYTMTLVQDATHVSEVAVLSVSGVEVFVTVNCGLGSNGGATCTEVIAQGGGGGATTLTESGTPSAEPIPVGIASLDPNFTGTAQPPTGGGASSSGSGGSNALPPVIAPPTLVTASTPTATNSRTSNARPAAGADAARTALVAWFIATVMAASAGLSLGF